MASTYIDLSSNNEEFVKVVQEDKTNNMQYENTTLLKCIVEELKEMNIHLSIITNEDL
jgi:hypothetical protein